MASNACQCTLYGRWPQQDFPTFKKLRPQSVTSRIQPASDVIVYAEIDERGYVGAKSRQRWLFYAYDRILMTTAAMIAGLMPLLFAHGPGANSRFGLGLVIVVGMAVGTFFTLLILPTLYSLLAGDHRRVKSEQLEEGK